MRKLSLFLLLVTITGLFLIPARGNAAPAFIAAQSGAWEDPRTWGRTGPAQPNVTVPGPQSAVTIPTGVTVTVAEAEKRVASLIVQSGATLKSVTGGVMHIVVTENLVNEGTILASPGTRLAPAGSIILESITGRLVNQGRIRGGDAGDLGGPGGFVLLRALAGEVENWGLIEGGAPGPDFPPGWVRVEAAGVIRHRGELRGGDVLLAGATVDITRGRVIAQQRETPARGDTIVSATQAVLAGTQATRASGRGVFILVGPGGVIDVQDVEDMAFLGRDRGLWLIGGPGARLYMTGNRGRFAPFQTIGGMIHVWTDPETRFLDSGLALTDLVAGNLDQGPGQTVPLPRLLVRQWQAGQPGTTVTWQVDVVNQGNSAGTFTLTAQDSLGWPLSVTPSQLPSLSPGQSAPVTITISIPPTASPGQIDTMTVQLSGECCVIDQSLSLALPVRSWGAHFPWLGHRGNLGNSGLPTTVHEPAAPQVNLTWPGANQGQPVQGRSLLVITVPPAEEVVAADLAYWDGTRWVPIATTVDMENFVEDGVWAALWDTSEVPLTSALVRARVWNQEGGMGQATRQVPIEHAPIASATAQFLSATRVRLDGSASHDLDGSIVAYTWDLGDGTTASGPTVEHTYASGRYVVRLTVTDAAGLTDEAVYVLDTGQQSWQEQTSCGCASATLVNAGLAPLPLPWEDEAHQSLGPDMGTLASGQMMRVNLAVEATLTQGSNALACKIDQSARGTWTLLTSRGERTQHWRWNGQQFPLSASGWGLVGYTRPSSLLQARGTEIRWVLSPGWGWRVPEWGLPVSWFSGPSARLEMTYHARIAGDQGSCSCTWQVKITISGGQPQVTITGGC